jgi:hypothetical protein
VASHLAVQAQTRQGAPAGVTTRLAQGVGTLVSRVGAHG